MRVLFLISSVIAVSEARRGSPSRFGTLDTPYTFHDLLVDPKAVVDEPKVKEVKAVKHVKVPCSCPHTKKIWGHTVDCEKCMKKVEDAMGGFE